MIEKKEVGWGCFERKSIGGKQEFRMVLLFPLAGLVAGRGEFFLLGSGIDGE